LYGAGELDRLYQETRYGRDGDLVFAHPHTGKPIGRSRLLKRFKAALAHDGVRAVRFHDVRHAPSSPMTTWPLP